MLSKTAADAGGLGTVLFVGGLSVCLNKFTVLNGGIVMLYWNKYTVLNGGIVMLYWGSRITMLLLLKLVRMYVIQYVQ
jgi:hypothetical protein